MSLKTIRSLAGGKPWKTVRNVAGGVGGKFAMILILMASLTGASAALGNYIFQTLGTELEAFTDEQVPNLRDSSAVTLAAGGLKNALTELILADDTNTEIAAVGMREVPTGHRGRRSHGQRLG